MKKTLMMVSVLGMGLTQANANVDSTTNSRVQPQRMNAVAQGNVQSPDALAMKIQELQGHLQPTQSVSITPAGLSSVQADDSIHDLINDLESKALQVTRQNDKLSTYEADLKARRLAEQKLEQERLADRVAQNRTATISNRVSPVSSSNGRRTLNNGAAPVIAARRASRSAHSRSKGLCARYVRKALQSAGYKFTPNASAYQYATRGTLRQAGFVKISNNSRPQVGDVVVISRSRAHPHGHIAIYDGSRWVSDFRQRNKSPYSRYYPYTTWRDARYLNNASANGLYMANR